MLRVYLHLTVSGSAIVVGEVVAEDREALVELNIFTELEFTLCPMHEANSLLLSTRVNVLMSEFCDG